MNATDLHEGCRIKAAEEGVLEYMLMKCIPALSKGGYYSRCLVTCAQLSKDHFCGVLTCDFRQFYNVLPLTKLADRFRSH